MLCRLSIPWLLSLLACSTGAMGATDTGRPLEPHVNAAFEVFSFLHETPAGGKGVDRIDVSVHGEACGPKVEVFDHAEIVIKRERFAQVRLVSPPRACIRCPSLRIHWIHEPAGRIEYLVRIYRRLVSLPCRSPGSG